MLYDIADHFANAPKNVELVQGELRMRQGLAAQQMLVYENGILSAATAFGKTVVCSYLIAQRKVNTLILLESKDLLFQWENELQESENKKQCHWKIGERQRHHDRYH